MLTPVQSSILDMARASAQVRSSFYGVIAQLVRAGASKTLGRGFESR